MALSALSFSIASFALLNPAAITATEYSFCNCSNKKLSGSDTSTIGKSLKILTKVNLSGTTLYCLIWFLINSYSALYE